MSGTITNPPPYASAPTLNATQQTARSPPAGATATGHTAAVTARRWTTSSARPQPSRTRTSQGPTVAAAMPPSSAYTTQRVCIRAFAQLGTSRVHPACTATAATAAPAPAPAPSTQSGGDAARKSADSARMSTRPGAMNAIPPTSAPAQPPGAVDRELGRSRAGEEVARGDRVLEVVVGQPAPPGDAEVAEEGDV